MVKGRKLNFTKRHIEELPLPTGGKSHIIYWDTLIRGLYCMVTARGAKSFYVRRKVKGVSERLFLGRFPELTVEQARSKASAFHAALADGKNLNDARRYDMREPTLGVIFDQYIERHCQKSRKTWMKLTPEFDRSFKDWRNRKASGITTEDIEKRHAVIGAERGIYAANRAIEIMRAAYNKAILWKLIRCENPVRGITKFPEEARVRILQREEFKRFFETLEEFPDQKFKDFVLISLLTGARKSNVLAMRWSDIDMEGRVWLIPGEETKNGQPHTVALTSEEINILKRRRNSATSDFVFPGEGDTGHFVEPKRCWIKLLKDAEIENLRMHDLRRSMASWMANTGANATLIQSALNHKDIKTTLSVYTHTVKDAERAAREKAQEFMLRKEEKVSGVVIPFRSKGGTAG